MRLKETSNKPKITDWISGISTFILVIITAVYVILTFKILTKSENELVLSQEPVVVIMPAEIVRGDVGEFELTLHNIGISDLKEIEIFEDYFVSLTPKGGNIQLNRFGPYSILPNSKFANLFSRDSIKFNIWFKAFHKEMVDLYNSELKGHRMMIAKLQIKFRRILDGKFFSFSKAYIIAGHGDLLIDYNTERDIKFQDMPTFEEIKNILGIRQ